MRWNSRPLFREIDPHELASASGRALLVERYRAVRRQVPLLYLIVLADFAGFFLTSAKVAWTDIVAMLIIVPVALIRLLHWSLTGSRLVDARTARKGLITSLVFSGGFSVLFCLWAIIGFLGSGNEQQISAVLFGTLAAVGCSYGLSSFPSAASLPLIFLAFPLSLLLSVTGEAENIAMGVCLALVTILALRQLSLHDRGFSRLVASRSRMASEREQAQAGEALALQEQAKANTFAETDHLTGLANRRMVISSLERIQLEAQSTGTSVAVALIDLDGFKPINDTFGHATGDSILQHVGERLRALVDQSVTVGRMGGDEFALIIPNCADQRMAVTLGEAVCSALRHPFQIDGRELRLSGSCGLVMLKAGTFQACYALGAADAALYSAKEQGRGKVALYSPDLEERHRRRATIEAALRDDGQLKELQLLYQPIFSLPNKNLRSFEALARWHCSGVGEVPPSEFIPIAEQSGAIERLSQLLLKQVIADANQWPEAISLSFNVSASQLCAGNFAQKTLEVLRQAGFDPRRLKIELTETALLVDFEIARSNLNKLRTEGARIVLDDFGAGHASISYLREIQFDVIKLDGSLIASAATSISGQRLLKGVVDLCASLGTSCVAECVETPEQLALLEALGCGAAQGFLLGSPVSAGAARELAETKVSSLGLLPQTPPSPDRVGREIFLPQREGTSF